MQNKKDNSHGQRWSIFRWYVIPDPEGGQTYLKRLRIIQTPWFGIYIHWIYLPDDDRHPHDHPWNFTSVILKGGYIEQVVTDGGFDHLPLRTNRGTIRWLQEWRRFSYHKMPMWKAHQIKELLRVPTVSLILVGPRVRSWGFWTETGFVPWREYDRLGLGPDPFMS